MVNNKEFIYLLKTGPHPPAWTLGFMTAMPHPPAWTLGFMTAMPHPPN